MMNERDMMELVLFYIATFLLTAEDHDLPSSSSTPPPPLADHNALVQTHEYLCSCCPCLLGVEHVITITASTHSLLISLIDGQQELSKTKLRNI